MSPKAWPVNAADRLDALIAPVIQARRTEGLYRQPRPLARLGDTRVRLGGRECTVFCSNDYLGLSGHPEVVRAWCETAEHEGVGSGASHLVSGHSVIHAQLEEALAEFVGRPRALLFSTGYMANMGLLNALVGPGDVAFEDQLNHASLLDGGWLSRGQMRRYPHRDVAALETALSERQEGRAFIVTDAVFSMDGDLAPLSELVALANRTESHLVVDDAHGLGVLGPGGGGTPPALGLSHADVPVYVGTLGKAIGTFGAFVAGSETLIDYLIQRARTYIYTTALPPALAAGTMAALQLARREDWRRDKLSVLIARFRAGAEQLGLPCMPSMTPIQPLLLGDARAALQMGQALLDDGFLVTPIRPPTVPAGTARLRITLSAAHEESDVDRLLDALARHAHLLVAQEAAQ